MDRTEQLKAFIATLDNKPQFSQKANQYHISIVTIYDEKTEGEWLPDFLANLPKVTDGSVELILCKVVRDKYTNQRPSKPEIRNGIQVNYVMTFQEIWNFADARNAANQAASGKWILSLDTDEIIINDQFNGLVELLKNAQPDVHGVSVKVYSPIGKLGEFIVGDIVRVFRNDVRIIWKCAIHESVMFSMLEQNLKSIESDISILHSGYDAEGDVIKHKLERNLELICRDYANRKNSSIVKNALKNHLYKTVTQLKAIENE